MGHSTAAYLKNGLGSRSSKGFYVRLKDLMSDEGMMYFHRPIRKLILHWFPQQKACWIFELVFWIIDENKLCDKHKFTIFTRFVQHVNLHR